MPKRKTKNSFFSGKKLLRFQKKLSRRFKEIPFTRIFLSLGVFFIVISLLLKIHYTARLSFSSELPVVKNTITTSIPKNIQIPSIKVSLPIQQTIIERGIWQISEIGVSHLLASGTPGQNKNIIYYGHNTNERLGKLHLLKKNDKIIITDQLDKRYVYSVNEILIVFPNEMDKLTAHNGETLTIYTCIGFADSKRLIVKAKRI